MVPADEVADALDADVGGEQEEAQGDELLGPALGRLETLVGPFIVFPK